MVASQEWVGKINTLPYLFSLTLISCQSIPLGKHKWKLEGKGVHQCTLYEVRPLEHRAEQWEDLKSKWKISQDISCHVYVCVCVCVCVSSSVVFDSSWPHGLCVCVCVCVSVAQLCLTLHDPWTVAHQTPLQNFPSRNTGVGCHFLLQGNYPADWTHGSCTGRRILYHCTTLEALKISNMWLNCFSFVIWHQLFFPL